jgi:hypothetical protein
MLFERRIDTVLPAAAGSPAVAQAAQVSLVVLQRGQRNVIGSLIPLVR